ncbi:MAG: SDR family oxidoreductase [Gemmatimonadales bacterium]
MSGARVAGGGPLEGVAAVVTGASRGIGEAIARSLAGGGASVALVARGREALSKIATELGPRAFTVPCDLTEPKAVGAAADAIVATFGGVPRILVNNAGIFRVGAAHELAVDDFATMLDLNLVAPFAFIRAFLPAMKAAKAGHIVTIGSVADRSVFPGNAGYSASKFGARAVHEVLRAETRGSGVRATLVSPGATDTVIWDGLEPGIRGTFPSRGEMLSADDVAGAVLFAVTRADWVNVDELRLSRS